MPTHEELVAAKDRAATVLLTLPNVTAVGLGGRVRDGQRIDELVLKVFVDAKVPDDQLVPAEVIPAEIEGLPTDVVQIPTVGQSAAGTPAPPGQPAISFADRDQDKYRPLTGGSHMQGAIAAGDTMGTLGCIMVSTTDATKAYAFTNWHVMQGANKADPTIGNTRAGQPTNKDSVTKCCSHIMGTLAAGARNTTTDAALIQLQPGMQWRAEVLEIGPLAGEHAIDATEAGAHPAVRFRGARSRLNGGIVEAIGVSTTVDGISYANAMVVTPNVNTAVATTDPYFFGQHGDSGSVVVNDARQVVAVFFALPNPPYSGGAVHGYLLPLADIKTGLAGQSVPVQVAVAATAGVVNTVPGMAMVAMPEELAPSLLGVPAAAPASERLVPVGLARADQPPAEALRRLEGDLERSLRGRGLVTFWLRHQDELLDLIGTNRRVAATWHNSGASGLFQLLSRMLSQPEVAVPETIHGQPVATCLDKVAAVLDRFGSGSLRADLSRARAALPDLGGLTYPRICAALETS